MTDNIMRIFELFAVVCGVLIIVYKNTQVIKIFEKMCRIRHDCIDSDIREIKDDIKVIRKDLTTTMISTTALAKSNGK